MITDTQSPPQPTSLQIQVADFLDTNAQIKDLEAKVKALENRQAQQEELLAELFGEEGIDSIVMLGRTVYRVNEFSANILAENRPAVIAACEELGLEGVTTVQTQTLKSYIREWRDERDDKDVNAAIPEQLRGLVGIYEQTRIRIRKK